MSSPSTRCTSCTRRPRHPSRAARAATTTRKRRYAKYHADISPIGGHDGIDEPSCNGDFHWLHHAKFECNYGVPWPFNFDKLFGMWVEYKDFKANGGKLPKANADKIDGLRDGGERAGQESKAD